MAPARHGCAAGCHGHPCREERTGPEGILQPWRHDLRQRPLRMHRGRWPPRGPYRLALHCRHASEPLPLNANGDRVTQRPLPVDYEIQKPCAGIDDDRLALVVVRERHALYCKRRRKLAAIYLAYGEAFGLQDSAAAAETSPAPSACPRALHPATTSNNTPTPSILCALITTKNRDQSPGTTCLVADERSREHILGACTKNIQTYAHHQLGITPFHGTLSR